MLISEYNLKRSCIVFTADTKLEEIIFCAVLCNFGSISYLNSVLNLCYIKLFLKMSQLCMFLTLF